MLAQTIPANGTISDAAKSASAVNSDTCCHFITYHERNIDDRNNDDTYEPGCEWERTQNKVESYAHTCLWAIVKLRRNASVTSSCSSICCFFFVDIKTQVDMKRVTPHWSKDSKTNVFCTHKHVILNLKQSQLRKIDNQSVEFIANWLISILTTNKI